jgi:hypothetical protein
VKGLAAGGVFGGLGQWRTPILAITRPGQSHVLSRKEFDLFVGERSVGITGPPHLHDRQRRISWTSAATAGVLGVRMWF